MTAPPKPPKWGECDGCYTEDKDVRGMDVGSFGKIYLCKDCWQYELRWRRRRNRIFKDKSLYFDLPKWEDATPKEDTNDRTDASKTD